MPVLAKIRSRVFPVAGEPAKALPPSLFSNFLEAAAGDPQPPMPRDLTSGVCAAPGCDSGWVKPWKNRTRPVFEGRWGCSTRCIQRLVASAIHRETGPGEDTAYTPHRHRIPLGLVLLAQNWITHAQLQSALEAQRASGHGRIGDWLVQICGIDPRLVTRALGMQWGCPVFTTEGLSPSTMALVMPKRFMVEFGLVPLRVAAGDQLYLASEDHIDSAAALAIEQMTALKVQTGLLEDARFSEARSAVLAAEAVPLALETVSDVATLAGSITRLLEQKLPLSARLVRVHQYFWLRIWLESGAFSRTGTLPAGTEDIHDCLFTLAKR